MSEFHEAVHYLLPQNSAASEHIPTLIEDIPDKFLCCNRES